MPERGFDSGARKRAAARKIITNGHFPNDEAVIKPLWPAIRLLVKVTNRSLRASAALIRG
jgi:hypothetical protein